MTVTDPFTSDNARVHTASGPAAVKLISDISDKCGAELAKVYGPKARVRWRQYFSQPGEWEAGFVSMYGFHIRGRGGQGIGGAVVAVADAIANRVDHSDPCPYRPDILPEGTFSNKSPQSSMSYSPSEVQA